MQNPLKKIIKRITDPVWLIRKIQISYYRNQSKRKLILLERYTHGQPIDFSSFRKQYLKRILKYAQEHCQYYNNLFLKYNVNPQTLENFDKLPLLEKSTIRESQKRIVSDEINHLSCYESTTGGSTGVPLNFFLTDNVDGEHQAFLFNLMGYNPGDKIVYFRGSEIPESLRNKNIFWIKSGEKDNICGSIFYSSLYLNSKNISYYINHLLYYKPAIIKGYPSFINEIACYILKNKIRIPFKIKSVQLTSEDSFGWQIENIKKAFNANIYYQYGHGEFCVFAYTFDETNQYYCSPLYGFTEVLDKNGLQVKKGEIGEIVVTGFFNFAMPLIRYKTEDLAVFQDDDSGVVKFEKLLGRAQDIIYNKNNKKVSFISIFLDHRFHAIEHIKKWQMEQNIPGELLLRIVRDKNYTNNDENEIKNDIKKLQDIDITFEYVESIPLTQRGKSKMLIQNIKHS